MKGLLEGRKIFVTGGSRGIGASVVEASVLHGAVVGFNYLRSPEEAEKVVKRTGGASECWKADVADLSSIEEAIGSFASDRGRPGLDGLVVNAGIYRRTDISGLSPEMWDRTMRVNLQGAYNTVKAAMDHMEEGSIVMISSQLALKGTDHGADYAASKAGLLGLSRSLSRELAPDIRVNSVLPGYVDTDLLSSDTEQKRKKRIEEVPLGRVAPPEEIAGPVVFLLSDMSSYITGADLDINGGLFIH